jgi:hypothetical protein
MFNDFTDKQTQQGLAVLTATQEKPNLYQKMALPVAASFVKSLASFLTPAGYQNFNYLAIQKFEGNHRQNFVVSGKLLPKKDLKPLFGFIERVKELPTNVITYGCPNVNFLLSEFIRNYNELLNPSSMGTDSYSSRTILLDSKYNFARPLQLASRLVTPIIPITDQSSPLIMPEQVDSFLVNPQWILRDLGNAPGSLEFFVR